MTIKKINIRTRRVYVIAVLIMLVTFLMTSITGIFTTAYAADRTQTIDGGFITDVSIYNSSDTELGDIGAPHTNPGSSELTALAENEKTSDVKIEYFFQLPRTDTSDPNPANHVYGVDADDTFTIVLPPQVYVPNDLSFIVDDSSNPGNTVFTGQVYGHDSTDGTPNTIELTFTQYAEDSADGPDDSDPNDGNIIVGSFYYESRFDGGNIEDDTPTAVDFTSNLLGVDVVTDIYFVEPTIDDLTFTKSSSAPYFDNSTENFYIDWTFTFNENDRDIADVVITDVLQDVNGQRAHELAYNTDGTPMITAQNVDQNSEEPFSSSYDNATNTITIDFDNEIEDTITVTITTVVLESAIINEPSSLLSIDNDGTITSSFLGTKDSNTETADVPVIYIEKTGTDAAVEDDENTPGRDERRSISWDIEVNPYSFNIDASAAEPITIFEDIPDGIQMEETSIEYRYNGVTNNPAIDFSYASIGGTNNYYFYIRSDITEPLHITFYTVPDPNPPSGTNVYLTQDNEEFVNEVTLNSPNLGDDTGNDGGYTPPGAQMPNEVINKEGSTDIGAGQIEWIINVNPNETTLNDIVLTDYIPYQLNTTTEGIELIDIDEDGDFRDDITIVNTNDATAVIPLSDITFEADPDPTTYPSSLATSNGQDYQRITITFPASITDHWQVTYRTQIRDEDFYTGNGTRTYSNHAYYTSSNATDGDTVRNVTANPEILEKSLESYDYNTKEIEWLVEVNENTNSLDNVRVWDFIPADMQLDTSSLSIDRIEWVDTNGDGTNDSFNILETLDHSAFSIAEDLSGTNTQVYADNPDQTEESSGKWEFTFDGTHDSDFGPNITQTYHIHYTTTFTDETQLTDNSNVTIDNDAYIEHDAIPNDITVTGSDTIQSRVIEKSTTNGSTNSGSPGNDTYIDWRIVINRNQINIGAPNASSTTGPVISDNLPAGLRLDTFSVKLYQVPVNSDGSLDNANRVEVAIDNSTQVYYDADNNNLFQFTFDAPINECYILEFTTDIKDASIDSFNNTADINSQESAETHNASEVFVDIATAGGYATQNVGRAFVFKEDEFGNLLVDAKFGIYLSSDPYDPTLEPDASAPPIDTAFSTSYTDPDTGITRARIAFDYLKYGVTYWIKEISPPVDGSGYTDYVASDEFISFTLVGITDQQFADAVADGTIDQYDDDRTYTRDEAFVNTLLEGSITFDKIDGAGLAVADCVFILCDAGTNNRSTDSNGIVIPEATSDDVGTVLFDSVPPGVYDIYETEAPEGYIIDTTTAVYTNVTVSNATGGNHDITLTDLVNAEHPGSVTVVVHSTFALMSNSFRVSLEGNTATPSRVSPYTGDRNMYFPRLAYGTYSASILPNSAGYIGNTDLGTITVASNTTTLHLYLARSNLLFGNPQTGPLNNANYLLLAAIILLGIVLALLIYDYNRRRKNITENNK